jgi:hypothetical protein
LIERLRGDQIHDTIATIVNLEDLIPEGVAACHGLGAVWLEASKTRRRRQSSTTAEETYDGPLPLARKSTLQDTCKHICCTIFPSLSFYNKKAMGELNTPRLAIIMDDTNM